MTAVGQEPHSGAVADLGGLLNAVPDAVLALGVDGEVLFANAKASELFADLAFNFELPALSIGHADVVEITLDRGAETRIAEMRQSRAMWRGEPVHLVMLRDVTEQRRLEARVRQNERLALIGRIAAEVAHEVNNPAAFIQGNLELLLADLGAGGVRAADEQRELLQDSLAGVRRIAGIVDDLRTFSRTGGEDVEQVDLAKVTADACRMLGNRARSAAQLDLDLEPVPAITGRRARLMQVVTNVLVNALQAVEGRPPAERRVRVTTRALPKWVRIGVQDNGVGMPDAVRQRVFEPFFTTKGPAEGTGIGLAVCVEIVRAHGGEIRIESREGIGTRVDIDIPLETGLLPAEPAPRSPAAAQPSERRRVLVVDDEESVLACYRRVLAPQFEVGLARDGLTALRMIREGPSFDVLVCDVTMPKLDGPSLYAVVIEELPEYRGRFLFATGGALSASARDFLTDGGVEVLHKPFGVEVLREAVHRLAEAGPPGGSPADRHARPDPHPHGPEALHRLPIEPDSDVVERKHDP